ncbi:hypothetical protein Pelo_19450 [Pelomyxa schiedti]|nr:hypothetical protein Pelo_19450 [Pelomyxa schiedti]
MGNGGGKKHEHTRSSTAPVNSDGKRFRVVVFGEPGVGKSTFAIQYAYSHFAEESCPEVDNEYRKQVDLDGESLIYEILDPGRLSLGGPHFV